MIIPKSEIFSSSFQDVQVQECYVDYINQVAIMGSVMLSMRSELGDTEDESTEMIKVIESVVKESRFLLCGLSVYRDDLVTKLLDSGLQVAFFDYESKDRNILDRVLKSFPRTRIGITVPIDNLDAEIFRLMISQYGTSAHNFLFRYTAAVSSTQLRFDEIKDLFQALKKQTEVGPLVQIYIDTDSHLTEQEIAHLGTLAENVHILAHNCSLKSTASTPSQEVDSSTLLLEKKDPLAQNGFYVDYIGAFIQCLRTDRNDGLYTTVVCDEYGICLGLVYSNEQSIRSAIYERRGIYWSRSRGNLWRKGDSSGMFQELLSVKYDCDRDALQFSVVQHGDPASFCHLMTRTCWGESTGIQKLEQVLIERKKAAPVGSYTKRLFDDPSLLQKKLLEEVQELVEAVDPDHVAAEAADVLYFMMTRCVAAGVGLKEIEHHLEKRSLKVTRRPGNAKAWRIEEAMKILEGQQSISAASP